MSLLDIIPGGSYLQTAIDTASKKISSEASVISGTVGKAYYGAQGTLYDALGSTAKTAQKVATSVTNYSLYVALAVAFVLLWPFIAPLLANAFSSAFKRGTA